MGIATLNALVVTVSDGVTTGHREDLSGDRVEAILGSINCSVRRALVPDERVEISQMILTGVEDCNLVVTTGGTGFGPRDVTPEATLDVLEKEAPGMAQLMITRGLEATEMAALSRLRVGSIGSTLVINLPGSPKGAAESLEAVLGLIPHACQLLAGDTHH